jgi:hypothetical protein
MSLILPPYVQHLFFNLFTLEFASHYERHNQYSLAINRNKDTTQQEEPIDVEYSSAEMVTTY